MPPRQQQPSRQREIRTDIPHTARIWNYWMGGRQNYEVDRRVGSAATELDPGITALAAESRRFLRRAVGHLAGDLGIRQFLDIGAGLLATDNTHEVACGRNPAARVVYVDNDPLVLTHGRTLLTDPRAVYLDADLREPDLLFARAADILDLDEPVAVMFMGVLGHCERIGELRGVVADSMARVCRGSYLAYWDGTTDSADFVRMCATYENVTAVPYFPRDHCELRSIFTGLELLEPGFVPLTRWRRPAGEPVPTVPVSGYGGVARKP